MIMIISASKFSFRTMKLTVVMRIALISIMAMMIMTTSCSNEKSNSVLLADSTIVAFGDSLTYGYGADPQSAYPSVLATLTGLKVINKGVNGNTSADALARVDEIITLDPDLVLLGVGGNDVLRRVQSDMTTSNITATIRQLKTANINVILIAEPYFSASALFGRASDNPIYQQIAASENIPLYSKRWSEVISDESLKSDQIHANAAGYRYFAEGLYEYLQEEGWVK